MRARDTRFLQGQLRHSINMMDCIKMKFKQFTLIKLLYIVFTLESAISLQDYSDTIPKLCSDCFQSTQAYQNVTYNPDEVPLEASSSNTPSLNLNDKPITPRGSLNETNNNGIYTSLVKILQQLRGQMKKNPEFNRTDMNDLASGFVEIASSIERIDSDWSIRSDVSEKQADTEMRGGSNKSRFDHLPSSISNINQYKDSMQSINFDDNKKSPFSKYLGPTLDLVTTKAQLDRKLSQQFSADHNWHPTDEYLPRPFDDNGFHKQENLLDRPFLSYTTPNPEYTSSLSPISDQSIPFKASISQFSAPFTDVKPLEQPRETQEQPDPTIILVRKQRNNNTPKRSRSAPKLGSRELPPMVHNINHETSLSEQDDFESTQATKNSINFGELGEDLTRHKSTPIYLQQVDTKHTPIHNSHYLSPYLHPQPAASQKIYYTVTTLPQAGLKGSVGTQFKSILGNQPQRDLLNQPQTIQITSVPANGLGINNNPALVRVNAGAFGNLLGSGFDLPGWSNLNGFPGRQVLMVNSERRLDWSWIVWPVAVVVALPLILSALFVPVFLKSIIIFIQILQSLGLMMPPSALSHHLSAAGSNLTQFN